MAAARAVPAMRKTANNAVIFFSKRNAPFHNEVPFYYTKKEKIYNRRRGRIGRKT
jgi:hypothetical protein